MTRFRQAIVCVLAVMCAAAPLFLQARFQAASRKNEQVLRAQAEQLVHGQNDQKRSKSSATNAQRLSNEETLELFRLRSEVGLLRAQTNLIERLRQGHALISESTNSEQNGELFAEALSADTIECMKNILSELPSALDRFTREHEGRNPAGLFELKDYLKRDGRRLTGIYTFEFVREEGPRPGDALLLREAAPRQKAGNQFRVYGFANGTALEKRFSEDDIPGRNQLEWERQQLGLPPPIFKSAP